MIAIRDPARLLVADDDRLSRAALGELLRRGGHSVESVDSGQYVLDRVASGGIDLVVLDATMPKMSGFECCRLLRGIQRSFLPVILVTGRVDATARQEALKAGADDFVLKPSDESELLTRVAMLVRIKRQFEELAKERERLEQRSVYDEGSGLYNERYGSERLSEEFRRAERYKEPFACAVVDLSEAILEGARDADRDSILKNAANNVRRSVREVDIVSKLSPTSFCVLLPSTHFAGAISVCERMLHELRSSRLESASPVTISMGVSLYPSREVKNKDGMLRSSMRALEHAREQGGGICILQQQGYVYVPPSRDPQPPSSIPPRPR